MVDNIRIPIQQIPDFPFFIMGFFKYETLTNTAFTTYFCCQVRRLSEFSSAMTMREYSATPHICADMPKDT
ncbi:hypothetical protein D6851_02450 [Altericroceibacterium spongiae]|uniref:Uncharacterized protein n=1 Tax=Altericroceibacterium spongiae TaxID=2320269 RepID=A0A420ERN8_9SPHN|nr:hypothetical protein D6851_02450 [Altericroceibacterium spongiae]